MTPRRDLVARRPWLAAVALALLGGVAGAQTVDDNLGYAVAKGRVTFRTYCASCHGEDAMGDGPIAQFLTVQPADLTRIAERRDGEFPRTDVHEIIDGRREVRTHGARDMPIWGDVFQDPLVPGTGGEPKESRAWRMIEELVAYLESLQVE